MRDQPIAKASTYTIYRKTRTNIHALSGIRNHDNNDQAIKTYISDSTANWDWEYNPPIYAYIS
jgi:hypothetical protein